MPDERESSVTASGAMAAAQQEQLEGRVTGLERDVQHMSQKVTQLADTVQTGFRFAPAVRFPFGDFVRVFFFAFVRQTRFEDSKR